METRGYKDGEATRERERGLEMEKKQEAKKNE